MKNMKYYIIGGLLVFLLVIAACTKEEEKYEVKLIDATEAKTMIDENDDEIILDVRLREEYNEKHIKDAINMPVSVIEKSIGSVVSDKNTLILVYCKSGKRAETAVMTLMEMGYTNVYSFGSIDDWKYDIVE